MLRFVWWSLRGRWERLATLCVGLLCISVCTTLLAGFTELSTLTADRQVSRAWHTTYDLLVRAPAALSPVERQLGIIDPAGPEQTYGGISLAQVATIAHIPHMAIAAPEAVVGWVPLQPYLPITFTAPGIYRVTTQLAEGNNGSHAGQSPGTTRSASSQRIVQTQDLYMALPLTTYARTAGAVVTPGLTTLPLADCAPDSPGPEPHCTVTIAAAWPLSTLLVGIDPGAEARLIGLHWQPAPTANSGLPLLMDTHAWAPLTATVMVERADPATLPAGATVSRSGAGYADGPGDQGAATAGSGNELDKGSWTTIARQQLDGRGLLMLLAGELSGHGQRVDIPPLQGGGVARYARVAYAVTQAGVSDGTPPVLTVLSAGNDAAGAIVRLPLLPQATTPWVSFGDGHSSFAMFNPVTLPALRASPAQTVPLGLYRSEPGGALPGLQPQHSTASWPPLLLTTVDAACALTGARCVSAVRVRVADLGPFGRRSEALLQQVAADIEARTGLHVDILTGASGRPVIVQGAACTSCLAQPRPGPQQAIRISEIWIQPHAAITIAGGVNAANVLLLLAAIGVAALALIAAALLAASGRRADVRVLVAVGWSGSRVLTESALEAAITALIAVLPAWAFALLLDRLGAPAVAAAVVPGTLGVAAAVYTMIVVLATRALLASKEQHANRARWSWVAAPWWWALLRRQIGWHRSSATLVAVAAAGACGLVSLLALVRWGLDGILYATLLGRQVQVGLSGIHLIAAFLTCVSAILAAGLTLLLVVRERRREFGVLLALGWTSRAVAAEVVREGSALGFLGGLGGGIVAALLFLALYRTWPPLVLVGGILGAATLGMLLCAAGSAYPALLAARLPAARVLSEE